MRAKSTDCVRAFTRSLPITCTATGTSREKLAEEFEIPADKTVRLPKLNVEGTPAHFSSSGMSWSYAPHWDRWNRTVINRGRMTFGHSWYGYVNSGEFPYEKSADMYARDPQ